MNQVYNDPQNLVTTALYYANGDLHIGHILEAIQADIYVRYLRLKGESTLFISGSDAHGTPIMLASKAKNIAAKDMVAQYSQEHLKTFNNYNIYFDNFISTDSLANKKVTESIFAKISDKIFSKEIAQAYDETAQMFLPDRYVKGTCPKCEATEQYGDSCEQCGSFYEPMSMKEPISTISGTTPVEKLSKHLFFDLPKCQSNIEKFLAQAKLEKPVKNKLSEWLDAGLNAWDISRDAPYYGFKIPGYQDKYFYVWVDAPIGYIAACVNLDPSLENLWQPGANCRITHFIGKDIMYFHGLFWPAMLAAANYKQPDQIIAHGFLTINGEKMSKSRGTMISANKFLEHFSADQIRYYIASKLSNNVDDIDLNIEDLVQKVNSDLVGKYLNIASRTANFMHKYFENKLLEIDTKTPMQQLVAKHSQMTLDHYQELKFAKAVKEIMFMVDFINQEIADKQPWVMAKDQTQLPDCHLFCSQVIYAFIDISILLTPIMPKLSSEVQQFLNLENLSFKDLQQNLAQHQIKQYPRLMERLAKTDSEVI